nr:hypothetical protein BV117_01704 [Haemophilus influenzae]
MEIFELPLLSNKPDTLKVKFVTALSVAELSTVRFPPILMMEPSVVRLPLLITFPVIFKADLFSAKFAPRRVALVFSLMVTLPRIFVGAFWEPKVILPPLKVMFLRATTPSPIFESVPSICLSVILPSAAFKVKSFFIKKAVFVEPLVERARVDPSETLKK